MEKGETKISTEYFPEAKEIFYLRKKILDWFDKNERKFPWRETKDPFKILMAEMMLRRTRAEQVKPVYNNFIKKYKKIEDLANADQKEIDTILYPLGLKWRSPAFILVAKEVRAKYGGEVPQDREMLKKLTGVGDYVAGAVLSIAYDKKEWIVDNNVVRIFKRYFGIETSGEGRRNKIIINLAKKYIQSRNPKKTNLAILDFSAMVCSSKAPLCKRCVLKHKCFHFINLTKTKL